jgi:hypothetical protein
MYACAAMNIELSADGTIATITIEPGDEISPGVFFDGAEPQTFEDVPVREEEHGRRFDLGDWALSVGFRSEDSA